MWIYHSIIYYLIVISSGCFGRIVFNNVTNPLIISIDEEEPVNTTITLLNATSDPPSQKIIYEIKSQNNEADKYIKIDSQTGRISNIAALDFEKIKVLTFNAYASDENNRAALLVIIQIHNINDNAPKFPADVIYQYVNESVDVGERVAQVVAVDEDQVDRLLYELVEPANGTLEINKDNGIITSKVKFDFEKRKEYSLNISGTDGEYTSHTTLILYVNDSDDQGTRFNQILYYAYLDEGNYPNKTFLVDVHAYDLDVGRNDTVSYSLVENKIGSLVFWVNSTKGSLYVTGNIDYEVDNRTFFIRINAQSTNYLASRCIVFLTIKDVNDNSPYFTQHSFYGKIGENALSGTPVLRVTAYDKDSGVNSMLTYYFGNKEWIPFLITDDGEIQVKDSLDREKNDSYTLEVVAAEKSTLEKRNSSTMVFIEVLDVNDNTPLFSVDSLQLQVKENLEPPVVLANVTATDKDAGSNSEMRYSIIHNSSSSFDIDPVTGVLTTTKSLDREQRSSYQFQIIVTDLAPMVQRRSSFMNVVVNVLDDNDNAPIFEEGCKDIRISELVMDNTIIGTVKAVDVDVGVNSKIKYSIIDGFSSEYFFINSSSGIIRTVRTLDYESQTNVSMAIQARDGGNKTASCQLVIHVIDFNDNSPVFSQSSYNFSVYENDDNNDKLVGKVQAVDADSGVYGEVVYTLQTNRYFRINASSGEIYTIQKLDRESQVSHELIAYAKDMASFRNESSSGVGFTRISITVLDEDDNFPLFVGPKNISIVRCRESLLVGVIIYHFTAKDKDIEENAEFTYKIISSEPNILKLNERTGELKVDAIVQNDIQSVTLEVAAISSSSFLKNDSVYLTISIISSNKTTTYLKEVYNATVLENRPPATFVIDLKASAGITNDGIFNFRIEYGGSGAFKIGNTTGVVVTDIPLDREEIDKYILVVSIISETEHRFATLLIQVGDVNDNAPYFTKNYTFTILENSAAEFYLSDIRDNDVNRYNDIKVHTSPQLQISILSGNDGGNFKIRSGRYLVSNTPNTFDFESNQKHVLKLMILPRPFEEISAPLECWVTIIVEDANDNPPEFNPTIITKAILHTAPIGTIVAFAQANDKDKNSLIDYDIVDSSTDGLFSIEKSSGQIFTTFSLSTSTSSVRRLVVSANDKRHTSLESLKVDVIIVQSNDITQLYSTKKPVDIKSAMRNIERQLSQVVNGNITVIQVGAHKDGSVIDLYGVKENATLKKEVIIGAVSKLRPNEYGLAASIGGNKGNSAKSKSVNSNERDILLGVLIAVSTLLLLFLLVSACFWLRKRKSSRRKWKVECERSDEKTMKNGE